jgi:hypothetical protein
VWILSAVLFVWNFAFLTYPQSRAESNAPLRFALSQQKAWGPGTRIVFRTFHPDLWTISYFNQQAAWIGTDRADVIQLDQNLKASLASGNPLWVEQTGYELIEADPVGRRWLELHERPLELAVFKDDKHDFRFHCVR